MNSLDALDKIFKITGLTFDQLTGDQKQVLAKYLDIFNNHNRTLYNDFVKSPSQNPSYLCYFTYIHHSRYHESRDSYLIVFLDKDITKVYEESIDYPKDKSLDFKEILSEKDYIFHTERLKKERHAGYC